MPHLTLSDKEWEARNDARTLADSEAIKEDVTRLGAAQAAAKKMADEQQEELDNIKTIAKRIYPNSPELFR